MSWGSITDSRNDFYPWATPIDKDRFTLFLSEQERLFLFSRYLKFSSGLYIEGNYSGLNIILTTKDDYEIELVSDFENGKTYFRPSVRPVVQNIFEMILITCKEPPNKQLFFSIY